MTYNLLCISVVNPVTYDAPSSVWHAGFDLWLMIRHIQLGGVHKLRLQDLAFFDHLHPSSCKRSLWTPPNVEIRCITDDFFKASFSHLLVVLGTWLNSDKC